MQRNEFKRIGVYGNWDDPYLTMDYHAERVIAEEFQKFLMNGTLYQGSKPVMWSPVEKTALAEGLAQRIAQGRVPEPMLKKRIISLDVAGMVAGTKYRGQFEERLKVVMKEIVQAGNVIIFIDELHTLVGAGAAEGSRAWAAADGAWCRRREQRWPSRWES